MKSTRRTAVTGDFHAVRFYRNAQSLARIVAFFIAEGIDAGDPAIVIATPGHRAAIAVQLAAHSLDVERLRERHLLQLLDADEVMSGFMIDGMPDWDRFEASMIPLLDAAALGHQNPLIRAYGEMVDVLWKGGLETAAIRLEMFWNRLAANRRFSLLCGYSMGSFYKDAAFDDICRQHTHVVSSEGDVGPVRPRAIN
jgi:hypothetical protein